MVEGDTAAAGGDGGVEFRWLQEDQVAMAMVTPPSAAAAGAGDGAIVLHNSNNNNNGSNNNNSNNKLLSRKRNLKLGRVSSSGEPTVKSLQAQVKRLEQQREFLSLLRPALSLDVPDVGAAFADVELQACDGSPVYAHKAVLVSSLFTFS